MPAPGDPQSLNRYSYVRNNPLRYNDPDGHCAILVTDFGEECYNESVGSFAPNGTAFVNGYERAMANFLMTEDEQKLEPLDQLNEAAHSLQTPIMNMLWEVADSFVNGDGGVAAALSNRMGIAGQGIIMAFEKTDYLSQRQQYGQKYYITRADIIAEKIARGHAYQKHVIEQGEFPGISNQAEFEALIVDVIKNPEVMKSLSQGRLAYWKRDVVVITDPNNPDWGTAFRPVDGRSYLDTLH